MSNGGSFLVSSLSCFNLRLLFLVLPLCATEEPGLPLDYLLLGTEKLLLGGLKYSLLQAEQTQLPQAFPVQQVFQPPAILVALC